MLLFHHYLTVTAVTLGNPHIWCDGTPLLGKDNPGILDAMLSISAFHLARTDILRAPKYLSIAEKHYSAAIRAATSMVLDVPIEKAQAVYVITTLISFTAFARGPRKGDLVLVADSGSVAWLSLLRGVRMVIGKFGSSVIFTGILDPNTGPKPRPNGCSCPWTDLQPRDRRFEMDHPGWDWASMLQKLSTKVATSSDSDEAAVFQAPVTSIIRCFEDLVKPKPRSDDNQGEDFVSVMAWIWALDEDFIDALNERKHLALVTLRFLGVLLRSLKGYWWLDSWGDHVLKELRPLLGDLYEEWLP